MSMITFEESPDPSRVQTRLTATISERALLEGGRDYAQDVIKKLIEHSVMAYRAKLDHLVSSILNAPETRAYVTAKTREVLDRYIEENVRKLFNR